MSHASLTSLSSAVKRIEQYGMYVDLIATSRGTVRVGSMPDIAKAMSHFGFREETVVVPDWEGSMAGDNRTGEEFVLWQAQVKGGIQKEYVGKPEEIRQMRSHLDETFSFFFDPRRIFIIKKRWLANWFCPRAAEPAYRNGDLKIQMDKGNIVITDHGQKLYDRLELRPQSGPDDGVEEVLARVARDRHPREVLEITPMGTGNGFVGTVSSFVVRFGPLAILIDPAGYPAHTLARHGVHWDDITHILITHNHEDHIQGFSACLKRAEKTATPLRLLTAPGIHRLLKKQFTPLCHEFDALVSFIPMEPGIPLQLDPIRIDCRWNHHFLPYGTLGLRIWAGGHMVGFSGDTKLDETINSILNRAELGYVWFKHCGLVLHEIDFDNPGSVHTHWKQVEKLQEAIPGQVIGYHTPYLANAPFPLAREGKTYSLEGI
ncbi:MAG: MBL fold metallo-hydrolase [Pseudomonadota bacterium]